MVRGDSDDDKVTWVELEVKRAKIYPRRGSFGLNATRLKAQDWKGRLDLGFRRGVLQSLIFSNFRIIIPQ